MSTPLAYQSFKCVLEHLDANKRYQISARCPTIRKLEKSLPLHINRLKIGHACICINHKRYILRSVPVREYEIAIKIFLAFFLEGRCIIQVDRLEGLRDIFVDTLPVGLVFQIRQLGIFKTSLQPLLPFLDTTSFPLKHLEVSGAIWHSTLRQLPIFETAENLTLCGMNIYLTNDVLLKLPHRNINLRDIYFSEHQLILFVQSLLNKKKEIGQSYAFCIADWGHMLNVLKVVGKQFGRKMKQKWTNRKSKNRSSVSFSITLPINSTSELYISGDANNDKSFTRMQVVPISQTG